MALAEAIDSGLEPVFEGVLETARERGVSIVASAHDFEWTPPETRWSKR